MKNEEGIIFSDKHEIAQEINKLFANNLGEKSENMIKNDKGSFKNYLPNNISSNFKFYSIDEVDLQIIIDELNPKNSFGHDGISSIVLKRIFPSIKVPLLMLINHSLSMGLFPNKLKLSKIVPVYKNKGNTDEMNNYRPISLLSTFSKVFEKVVFKQISEYFQLNNMFFNSQYGFRENHSCEYAALELVEFLKSEIGKKHIPVSIF